MASSQVPSTTCPSRADQPVEAWLQLDEKVLRESLSGRVCLTFRWFAHHVSPGEVPMPFCRLHRGQLAHVDQLRLRCNGWSEPLLLLVTPLQEMEGA
jgi:hypothetical protein